MELSQIQVLAVLVAAVVGCLLILGVRGRWVGGEPRCRRCSYQLTGIQSGRCPECGLVLDRRGTVYGRRRRRWIALALGLLVWGIWVSGHEYYVGVFRTTKWIRYVPLSIVLRHASNGDYEDLREIERRIFERELSTAQTAAVLDVIFEKDGETLSADDAARWSTVRESLELAGTLEDQQKQRAYARFAEVSADARSPIRQGDPLVLRLRYAPAESVIFTRYGFWEYPTEIRAAGQLLLQSEAAPVWKNSYPECIRGINSMIADKAIPVDTGELPVGRQAVEYRGRQFFARMDYMYGKRRLVWSRDSALTANVEVLPADAPDPVVVVDDPRVPDELGDAITIRANWNDQSTRATVEVSRLGEASLYVKVTIYNPTELPFAFSLGARVDGREIPVTADCFSYSRGQQGLVVCRPGDAMSYGITLRLPFLDADDITLILRSDPEVARRTPDIFRIWGGELTFGPYEVDYHYDE